ncbi:MAG TPA: CPBP family glutamic-type intramembrane protease [Lacipirellulaceae bacterium]
MKQLYSAKDALEAHDLRLFLAAHGIEAKVFGDNNALESVFAFTPSSAPAVFVQPTDFEQAVNLIEEFCDRPAKHMPQGTWTCDNCHQVVEEQFDTCWKCETPRGDAVVILDAQVALTPPDDTSPAVASEKPELTQTAARSPQPFSTRSAWEIRFEVAVVLAVAWFPYCVYGLLPESQRSDEWSFVVDSIWSISNSVPVVAVVLYIMYRSELPWSAYGFKRPRLFDVVSGFCILVATSMLLTALALPLFVAWGADPASEFMESSYEFLYPSTPTEFIILALMAIAIGVGEEFAMRGYLIPRLEQLFHSTFKSIAVSSLIFASYHLYQGIGSTIWIFFVGLAFGCAFCWLRRIWPLVIAHAFMDFVALSGAAN